MATPVAYLTAVIGADITDFRHAMNEVRSQLTEFGNGGLSRDLQNIGRDLTYAITVPLAGLGAVAVSAASEFDAAMRNVASISQTVAGDFDGFSDRVLEFGATLRGGATEAAEAFYEVFSAGFENADEAFRIATEGAALAEAGLVDTSNATLALVTSMQAYYDQSEINMGVTQRFSDVWTQMVQLGVGRMEEFMTAAGRMLPTSAALGVSFEEVGASLAFLTQGGLKTYNAATAMNAALRNLLAPSDAMLQVFQQLGVETGDELISSFGSLEEAMRAIYGVVGDSTTAWAELFTTAQGQRYAFQVFENMDEYSTFIDRFNSSLNGATDRARQQQLMSFAAHVDLMTSGINALAITVGQTLIPFLFPLVDGITAISNIIRDTNPAILEMGVVIAGVVAAIPLLIWAAGIAISPLGLLAIAIGGIVNLATGGFGDFGEVFRAQVEKALPSLGSLRDAITEAFNIFGNTNYNPKELENMLSSGQITAGQYWDYMSEIANDPGHQLNLNIVERLQLAWQNVAPNIGKALEGIFTEAFNWVRDNGLSVIDDIGSWMIKSISNSLSIKNVTVIGDAISGLLSGGLDFITSGLSDGIDGAVNGTPQIQSALAGLGGRLSDAFSTIMDTFIPRWQSIINKFLGNVFGEINDEGVRTGIQTLLDNFNVWVSDALPTKEEMNTLIQDFFSGDLFAGVTLGSGASSLQNAFGDLFKTVGDWLKSDAPNSIGFLIGTIVGTVGSTLVNGIKALFQEGETTNAVGAAFVSGLSTGFESATSGAGVTLLGDKILVVIGAALAFVAVTGVGSQLLIAGFLNIGGVVIRGIAGGLLSLGGTVLSTVISAVLGRATAAAATSAATTAIVNTSAYSFLSTFGTGIQLFAMAHPVLLAAGAVIVGALAGAIIYHSNAEAFTSARNSILGALDQNFSGTEFDTEIEEIGGAVAFSLAASFADATGDPELAAELRRGAVDYADGIGEAVTVEFTNRADGASYGEAALQFDRGIRAAFNRAVETGDWSTFGIIAEMQILGEYPDLQIAVKGASTTLGGSVPTAITRGLMDGQPEVEEQLKNGLGKAIRTNLNQIKNDTGADVFSITNTVGALSGGINGLIPGVTGAMETLRGVFRNPIDAIIAAWNNMLATVSATVTIGGNVVQAPTVATGGVGAGNPIPPTNTGGQPPRPPVNPPLPPRDNGNRGGGGGRAFGGNVRKGVEYIVGEKRPEYFTPNRNGRVAPKVGTGNTTNHITIIAHDTDKLLNDLRRRGIDLTKGIRA